MGAFDAVRVSEHVYWVGAIDWGIRDFHGYSTSRGSTYNAYLVIADDIILIDTVKAPFFGELMARVASVTDPANIRYIISNHAEMDHSGSLPAVIDQVRPEKIFASKAGVKALKAHFQACADILPVVDGEPFRLGGTEFICLETKMLHWPDSMATYLPAERLLFSQDGFGMHLATSERFADRIPRSVLYEEGAKYYANILTPYSPLVLKLLERVKGLGIEIDYLCPDHGPVWRKDAFTMIELWGRWALQAPTMKAVVAYDTMWGSTEKMAKALGEGLISGGATVVEMPLRPSHRSEVAMELLEAGAFLVGTPTINNTMFPTVADVLTYVGGLKFRNLIGASFGSFGWSGEGPKRVAGMLAEMEMEMAGEPLRVEYVPDSHALEKARGLGAAVSNRLKEVVGSG